MSIFCFGCKLVVLGTGWDDVGKNNVKQVGNEIYEFEIEKKIWLECVNEDILKRSVMMCPGHLVG